MDDLTRISLDALVEENLRNNSDNMAKAILQGIESCPDQDSRYAKMIVNAVHYSVHASVQLMAEVLLQTGILQHADESELRKQLLRPLAETHSSDKE